jgi:hypothetical protein
MRPLCALGPLTAAPEDRSSARPGDDGIGH